MAENELMNVTQQLGADQTGMYCSIQGASMEAKKAVFNASNNPDHRIADYINKKIVVRDVLAERIDLADEETGEVHEGVRVVLIDKDGKSYQAVSTGIYSALRRAVAIFGEPTWEEGIPIIIKQVQVGKGSMLTFEIA